MFHNVSRNHTQSQPHSHIKSSCCAPVFVLGEMLLLSVCTTANNNAAATTITNKQSAEKRPIQWRLPLVVIALGLVQRLCVNGITAQGNVCVRIYFAASCVSVFPIPITNKRLCIVLWPRTRKTIGKRFSPQWRNIFAPKIPLTHCHTKHNQKHRHLRPEIRV